MTVRFLADEDLHIGLIEGLQAREPAIDILNVKTAGLRGTPDPDLLEPAAEQGRVVLTHDRDTMTHYFLERVSAGKPTYGIFVILQYAAQGPILEWLLLVWAASESQEWRDQIVYLPVR